MVDSEVNAAAKVIKKTIKKAEAKGAKSAVRKALKKATAKKKKNAAKPKRPLTTVEKRAKTRRRNTIKKKARQKQVNARSGVRAVDQVSSKLDSLSDGELKAVQKAIDALVNSRKAIAKIYNTAYSR